MGARVYSILFTMIILSIYLPFHPGGSTNNIQNEVSSFIPHTTIHIDGNSSFNSTNGVVSGIGTIGNPFIIANWSINSTNDHGIFIENTNAHFVIRNCNIYGKRDIPYHGINLNNVTNGTIENNYVTNNSYGIVIGESSFIQINNNSCSFSYRDGISVGSSSKIVVFNNSCNSNEHYGIGCYGEGNNITRNICKFNEYFGIKCGGERNIIFNNTCNLNDRGIRCEGLNNEFVRNTFISNYFEGIDCRGRLGTIRNNYLKNNYFGIELHDAEYNSIIRNICFAGGDGISLHESHNNIISGNNFSSNSLDGISLYDSHNNIISQNNCSANYYDGIEAHRSKNNSFTFNKCILNDRGIDLIDNCDRNSIINNTLNFNSYQGIAIGRKSDKNIIINNTCKSNEYGISLYNGFENLIYNNYFLSKKKTNMDYLPHNTWNISKIPGRNIIGGPYLGGNYWSGFEGVDKNGDGLGDALHDAPLPYGPGDYRPLFLDLEPPSIKDSSKNIPRTGNPYYFRAIVQDNGSIKNVSIKYWYDQNIPTNTTIERSTGDTNKAEYYLNITTPTNAIRLCYIIYASDMYGHSNSTDLCMRYVIDDDLPVITDYTSSKSKTGKTFLINFTVEDNVFVANASVEYWYNKTTHQNVIFYPQDHPHYYNLNIEIPEDAKRILYTLSAFDNSSNFLALETKKFEVIDILKPTITDLCSTPTTGDNYTFQFQIIDNIRINEADLEYWFDDNKPQKISFSKGYDYFLKIPHNVEILNYRVSVSDESNNLNKYQSSRAVIDNDPPIIADLTKNRPSTGLELIINCSVLENLIIKDVILEYQFDTLEHNNVSMKISEDNFGSKPDEFLISRLYTYLVSVPINASLLQYKITVLDGARNIVVVNKTKRIIDIIPPEIIDLTDGIPTTGDEFEINAFIRDNIGLDSVILEYIFDYQPEMVVEFNGSYQIKLPKTVDFLEYSIKAVDINMNNATVTEYKLVLDNDKPVIVDNSTFTEKNYHINLNITDNIEVVEVKITYWFDIGGISKLQILSGTDTYEKFIFLPPDASKLHYQVSAEDLSGNLEITEQKIIDLTTPKPQKPDKSDDPAEDAPDGVGAIIEEYYFWIIWIIVILIVIICIGVYIFIKHSRSKKSKKDTQNIISESATSRPVDQTKKPTPDLDHHRKMPPNEQAEIVKMRKSE